MSIILAALAAMASPVPPVTTIPPICVMPTVQGTGSGSGWGNAGTLAQLGTFITQAYISGAQIWLRADAGSYPDAIFTINKGGSPTRRIQIRGANLDGSPAYATFSGNRPSPFVTPASPPAFYRNTVIGLLTGANHLSLSWISVRNSHNGLIRAINTVYDLQIEDCEIRNARQGSNAQSASIVGLTVRRFSAHGFSKRAIILAVNSSDILIEDCYLDSEFQDGDNFSGGVVFDGTAHDAVVRRVTALNCLDSVGSNYWNADAFSSERGNYRILFEQCVAAHCSDAGWDLKSKSTTLIDCLAFDNKRNYRTWGEIDLIRCTGRDPYKRGGSGSVAQIGAYQNSFVRVIDCVFSQTSNAVPFYVEKTGFLAVDALTQSHTTRPVGVALSRKDGADAQFTTLDTSDIVAPALTSPTALSADEGAAKRFNLTADEAFIVELQPGTDTSQFAASARYMILTKQDYEYPHHPDQIVRATIKLRDANNNRSPSISLPVTIADIADDPIGPVEAFAYPGANGFWYEIRPEYCWEDVAGTIPASVGGPVARFDDLSGFGNFASQPDEQCCGTLQWDGGDVYWLQVDGYDDFYYVGDAGEFRFAQMTTWFAIERAAENDGTGSNENRQYLYSFPRSATDTTFNSLFSLGVIGGNDAWARVGANNFLGSSGGTAARPIVISLRSTDGMLRSDALQVGDGPDTAAIAYPGSLAGSRARLFGSGQASPGGLYEGRFHGAVGQNRGAGNDILLRIDKQIIQLAGRQI